MAAAAARCSPALARSQPDAAPCTRASARAAAAVSCRLPGALRAAPGPAVTAPGPAARRAGRAGVRPLLVTAAVKEHEGKLDANGLRFAVVVGRFNDLVTRLLLAGALRTFAKQGAREEDIQVVWVPGAFELGVVSKAMAKSGSFDAVLALGAVVRGDTTHYDAVAGAAASGVLGAGMDSGVPCVFGVLTTETMEQALDRAGGKAGNNGEKSAATAVEMANLMRALRSTGAAAALAKS